jgi:hypothetical protein
MQTTLSSKEMEAVKKEIRKIQKLSHNSFCADCNSRSVMCVDVIFGCFLCSTCAGIHREFGTHICRVKHLSYDNFTAKEMSVITATKGNLINIEYEAKLNMQKPTTNTDITILRKFITSKYKHKYFYQKEKQNIVTIPTVQESKNVDIFPSFDENQKITKSEINDPFVPFSIDPFQQPFTQVSTPVQSEIDKKNSEIMKLFDMYSSNNPFVTNHPNVFNSNSK